LRVELEMDPELPAVLLMGGGEGMGPVKKTAVALGESLFDKQQNKPIGQLIIICGRNKSLASTLESMEWKIPVKVISHCNHCFLLVKTVVVENAAACWHDIISSFSKLMLSGYRLEDSRSRWRSGWVLVIVLLLR